MAEGGNAAAAAGAAAAGAAGPVAGPVAAPVAAPVAVYTADGEIDIDGSFMEGGGQLVRNCVLLGALLTKPLFIHDMRGKRSKPGLAAQHLTGIQLVAKMSNAKLRGAEKDSQALWVHPSVLRGGEFLADTHTAGSVALIVQVSFPCTLFCDKPCVITCRGGTNALAAPQIDYTLQVFAPMVARMGAVMNLTVNRRGYYPKGQGEIVMHVNPIKQLQPIQLLDPGVVTKVHIRVFVSKLPAHIAERLGATSRKLLEKALADIKPDIQLELVIEQGAADSCTGLIIIATTSKGCILAGSALGERGVKAEVVAERAVEELLEPIRAGACVDSYLQDQLIVFMALANGTSKIKTGKLETHTQTAIHFCSLMTGCKFTVTESADKLSNIIECEGIGYQNKHL